MLHFLFLLSIPSVAGTEVLGAGNFSVSPCGVRYYGQTYTMGFLDSNDGMLSFNSTGGDYVTFPSPADPSMMVTLMSSLTSEMEVAVSKLSLQGATLRCAFLISLKYNEVTTGYLMYADLSVASLLYAYGRFPSTTYNHELATYSNNQPLQSAALSWTDGEAPVEALFDLTGCRYGYNLYKVNTTTVLPDCTVLKCSSSGDLTVTLGCGWFGRCDGSGRCMRNCSIIALYVGDFNNGARDIMDRCRYQLLSSGGLQVYGQFQDRRRTDISFLASLHLIVNGTSIDVLQGGRVLVNGSESTQVPGVLLNKTPQGVTVEVFGRLIVFFDGTVAYIQLTQSPTDTTAMTGMCVDNLLPNEHFLIEEDDSCKMTVEQPPLTGIDCPSVEAQCDAISTFVNDLTLQSLCPYLMCRYPDLDNMFCSFNFFYSLKYGVIVKPECVYSACANHICAPHEFCGLTAAGDPACFCRPVWAYTYGNDGVFGLNGESTYCGDGEASLQLVSCLLEEKGVDVSQLHLLDPTCKGVIDSEANTVMFYFNVSHDCSSEVSSNETHIIYHNAIQESNPEDNGIIRSDQIYLDFSCAYEMPPPNVMTFTVRSSSLLLRLNTGLFSFTLEQSACRDSQCSQPLSSEDVLSLGENIWIHLKASELATSRLVLSTQSCWISDKQNDQGTRIHHLITNGCADGGDRTVTVSKNGVGELCSFAFRIFQFIGFTGEVHMHCQVHLCLDDGTCAPVCPPPSGTRRRRSVPSVWSTTILSMSWANQDSPSSMKIK